MTSQVIIKLEKLVFYLFILCIPFQTRLILAQWPVLRSFSEGGSPLPDKGFNEWASAFLYLSDLFILGLLALWLLRTLLMTSQVINKGIFQKKDFMLFGFLAISALSITQSNFVQVSWYQLVKLLEFVLLYFYVRSNLDKVFSFAGLLRALVFSGIFQSLIAISQYIKQESLGLWFLGESPLHLGNQGIASFYVGSQLILRAYGTLPHPNVLAAFLFVTLISFAVLFIGGKLKNKFWLLGYGIILYAFFLTYSRTLIVIPIAVFALFLIVVWFNKRWRRQILQYKRQLFALLIISFFIAVLFIALNYQQVVARAFFSKDDEAISLRLFYNRIAGHDFLARTWLGSGVGTFVPKLMTTLKHVPESIFQPVHNVYLLILAETGLFGLVFWGVFIKTTIRNYIAKHNFSDIRNVILPMVLLMFLLTGFFDHFFWTLQQGRLLLWLTLALLI